MKKWILKAVIQKLISFLPYKHRINYLFQKYITRGVQLSDAYFEDRLIHLGHHLAFYRKHKGENRDIQSLELGTGWYPVVPMGLFLAGVETIYTVDISKLMNKERVLTTVNKFVSNRQHERLTAIDDLKATRWETLQYLHQQGAQLPFEKILDLLHIRYLVADARKLSIPDCSIDFITSNNTFEHVYPDILKQILLEFHRILKPDGLMSHFIDMSDHFAHLDQHITIYNFLQFSPQQWQLIDNTIQPQNRWRIGQYRKLYQQLNIPITEELNRPGDQAALQTVNLASPFSEMPKEDVAISHSYVISAID